MVHNGRRRCKAAGLRRRQWPVERSGRVVSIAYRASCCLSLSTSETYKHLSKSYSVCACYRDGSLSITSMSSNIVQTISSPHRGAGRSCRPHHWSSGSPLVVAPSSHPCEAWLRITLLCRSARHRAFPEFTQFTIGAYAAKGPIAKACTSWLVLRVLT